MFPDFSGVRVFDRDYKNPRIYTFNVGYEQEFIANWSAYADYTWARGRHLTRFLNYNRANRCLLRRRSRHRQRLRLFRTRRSVRSSAR